MSVLRSLCVRIACGSSSTDCLTLLFPYSMGLKEQIIFPEIDYDKIEKLRGMNIAITTTAQTDEEARELLRLMGAPFAN